MVLDPGDFFSRSSSSPSVKLELSVLNAIFNRFFMGTKTLSFSSLFVILFIVPSCF